jgi:hypothetical protein
MLPAAALTRLTAAWRAALVGWWLAAAGALAGAAPVQPPTEVAAALPGARLVGQGTLRWLGLTVYDARLWAAEGFDPARLHDSRFALELRYARRLDGQAITDRSLEEMRRSGPLDEADTTAWREAMQRAFPDVAPGDRLTGLHEPAAGSRFYLNGRFTAAIDHPRFVQRFYAIWLGAQTSQPALRARLLGAAR